MKKQNSNQSKTRIVTKDDIEAFFNCLRQEGLLFTLRKVKNRLIYRSSITENFKVKTVENQELPLKKKWICKGTYQANMLYPISQYPSNIRLFAFYLPQFHRFPENDRWWGEGFTEWTNTRKCTPSYEGHYQPRSPHKDIGYYDLSVKESIEKQVKLANEHGISGFAFYYYWFSGKRLMTKPLDMFYENKDLDIEYCLIWANENWTRTWDGLNNDVLIAQEYTNEDNLTFIKDLKKYILDDRYLKIDGKPVIIVYAPQYLPNPKVTFNTWREVARKEGVGEILIWCCRVKDSNAESLGIQNYIDGEVEFPPHNLGITPMKTIMNEGKPAYIFDYHELVEKQIKKLHNQEKSPAHKTAMLEWDNASRRSNYSSFSNFSFLDYYHWISENRKYTEKTFPENEQIMFVNAWNEWAEGTYLEPDVKFGYSNINYTTQALLQEPCCGYLYDFKSNMDLEIDKNMMIAVQIHMYYPELLPEVIEYTNNIPTQFDLMISTDSAEKLELIKKGLEKSRATQIFLDLTTNIGRDMYPFIYQMEKYYKKYDVVCHIHTKKSKHMGSEDAGERWRNYLYSNLLGNTKSVNDILGLFSKYPKIGMIYPEIYPPLIDWVEWGSDKELVTELLNKMYESYPELPDVPDFPTGNMFWIRMSAIDRLIDLKLSENDFEKEVGQIDGTLAHALERAWTFIVQASGYIWVNYKNNKE